VPHTPCMEHEHDEPLDGGDGFSMPSDVKQNRWARFKPDLLPDLRKWLTRVSRVHAQLCTLARLYAEPMRAGGQSHPLFTGISWFFTN